MTYLTNSYRSFAHTACCSCVFVLLAIVGTTSVANAQLPQDVRDVFEGMLGSLDDDLKELFQQAIADDTDKVEFSAEQFLRFRKHPANPFDGLDRIDIKPGGGNVALKFELPSMRNRKPALMERQHSSLLNSLSGPVRAVASGTVRVFANDRHVAMGAIIDSDGLIVTKASEVALRKQLRCRLSNQKTYDAEIVGQNETHDIAILKINAKNLSPIRWSSHQPALGEFLLTPDIDGTVTKLGCYSVHPRSTQVGERAFLGVQPVFNGTGVAVFEIEPGAASHAAGLRDGDIITMIDQHKITDVAALVKSIRNHKPGDRVKIEYLRAGQARTGFATLGGNKISSDRAARFKMMNRLGAVPSRRCDDFSSVFQHDTPLFPENCGGPIVNLDGEVIGLNIARKGRAASYALPADVVRSAVRQMTQDRMAKAK